MLCNFHTLNLFNVNLKFVFQYLRLRFNQHVRLLGSVIFIIKMMLYIPIVIYVPALAFSQGKAYKKNFKMFFIIKFQNIFIFIPVTTMGL